MKIDDFFKVEILMLLINRLTGYDFTHYAKPVLLKRIEGFLENNELIDLDDLIMAVLKENEKIVHPLIQSLTITYSMFFRDAEYFKRLHFSVIPQLDAFQRIKVWTLGCSTGEEVYSLAMLFKIHGNFERVTMLATDIHESSLNQAEQGYYEIKRLAELREQYANTEIKSHETPLESIDVEREHFRFNDEIKSNIKFAKHNIVNGGSLGKMHFISCRNLLIYLSIDEQVRIVKELLIPSLVTGGYLMLGSAENIKVFNEVNELEKLSAGINIYKKV
jgi:chemotaxis protein methyltransferase CheR